MTECHITFRVTVTLTSDLVLRIIVFGVYLIFFQLGIPNLVCICILGCRSVTYYFGVTVTLTSDLVLKNNCGRSISLILFEIRIPNLVCGSNFGWQSVTYHFWVIFTLTYLVE